ncbi:MAG TPA: DNA repair and recombination protein RadB [Candidatus Thermoplasmatota archaeon]|nr:DNA repair and recombination protein RadB [Candidatus Thermoplasmatota archaeon]
MRVPIGCSSIDHILGGGVESGALTEFFGEAGVGKTNVCLMLARNVARQGRKAIYIDTEGVSFERLQQICGADFNNVKSHILFFEPYTLKEQEAIVEKACRLASGSADIGIVILDSATLLYRASLGGGMDVQNRRAIGNQLQALVGVARRKDLPVVITNQVFTNVETDVLEPLGGQTMRHISKAVIRLEKVGIGRRMASTVKHRSLAEGQQAPFIITSRGLEAPDTYLPPLEAAPVAVEVTRAPSSTGLL